VLFEEVAQVLGALDDSGVRHWVGGGWRAAVLVGRQTSEYRDLDLAVNADDLPSDAHRSRVSLTQTDWLSVRIELRSRAIAGWTWIP